MKPKGTRARHAQARYERRQFLQIAAGLATTGMATAGVATSGCAPLKGLRLQSPEENDLKATEVRLIGDVAVPQGNLPQVVESVGLVTGLPGTGSDPPVSSERSLLIDEMQKRGVVYPNQVLASNETEMVLVRAYLRPGIQKGDHFDVELRVPTRSECTSLRGGWLMETRLRFMAELKNQVREGKTLALAEGAVLVDPSAEGERDRIKLTRGRVLGGGVAIESRKLGLMITRAEFQNVTTSAQIGTAVNHRFHTFVSGVKEGVATPENDKYIELTVHPRYKDNVERYLRVIRSLPLRETAAERIARLALLERQLLDHLTAAPAALKLEALGKEGVKTLRKGIESNDLEVKFYSAEALAYLDETDAVGPLAEAAKHRAFRAFALTALSAMDDYTAFDALRELLDVSSAETRYGAFRALWAMNSEDPLVRGESLGDQFSYHVLETKGPPLIHATRSFRAEMVLFGPDQRLLTPCTLEAGKSIQVISRGGDEVTISRFAVGEQDQKRVVSTRIDEIIREVVALGGTYPDVVQLLHLAKMRHNLDSRFEIDALPQGGRVYDRPDDDEGDDDDQIIVANPLPGLFARPGGKDDDGHSKKKKHARRDDDAPEQSLWSRLYHSVADWSAWGP
ncbi:MAG TPA: flagellar basal body P-ring protein FlgI [Pirellulales bacterium]